MLAYTAVVGQVSCSSLSLRLSALNPMFSFLLLSVPKPLHISVLHPIRLPFSTRSLPPSSLLSPRFPTFLFSSRRLIGAFGYAFVSTFSPFLYLRTSHWHICSYIRYSTAGERKEGGHFNQIPGFTLTRAVAEPKFECCGFSHLRGSAQSNRTRAPSRLWYDSTELCKITSSRPIDLWRTHQNPG